MHVLIDKYVPFLRGKLEPFAEVEYLEPGEFTPVRVHDADALIIRTRTKCNSALLEGSRVKFIATATIGFDHIDRDYCDRQHIYWTNSPGCNAQAVCDYIEEALRFHYSLRSGVLPGSNQGRTRVDADGEQPVLGIVGVGHVGSRVAQMAEQLGFRVLLNDPPRQIGVSLDEIAAQCDAITFHTPLIRANMAGNSNVGNHPTYHLCDAEFLSKCKPGALIINAARGGIVDEAALMASSHPCIIDTWEAEPNLNLNLLDYAELASYHIAGYSLQGKINASNNCLMEIGKFFNWPVDLIPNRKADGDSADGWLMRISEQMKSVCKAAANLPATFENLRETYILR